MWKTKKQLRQEIENLTNELDSIETEKDFELIQIKETFPLMLGQTVYEVQLRNAQGRFTKTKASRSYSYIDEVVVDKKNYFKLVDKLEKEQVFVELASAEKFLRDICVD